MNKTTVIKVANGIVPNKNANWQASPLARNGGIRSLKIGTISVVKSMWNGYENGAKPTQDMGERGVN